MTTVSTPRRSRRRRRSSISFTKQIDQIARPEAARQSSRGTAAYVRGRVATSAATRHFAGPRAPAPPPSPRVY